MADLRGDAATCRYEDCLQASARSVPLPPLRVVDERAMPTLALDPAPTLRTPSRVTSAMRVPRVAAVEPIAAFEAVRRYLLHTPCRPLARDDHRVQEQLCRDTARQARQ
jgi:hypothetical protein